MGNGDEWGLKGIIFKNLQMVAKGGMAPRPMVPTMTICGP